jgi:hypothetical protein
MDYSISRRTKAMESRTKLTYHDGVGGEFTYLLADHPKPPFVRDFVKGFDDVVLVKR